MADTNTDFLRFSAYSIKDYITRRLSQDTNFTDQIYEGSNISILIDLVSYMFQCLTYLLNTSAAESMFSDTQIYENINRLVKLIGYNPKGIRPASARFYIDNKKEDGTGGKYENKIIYRYSAIDTGKTDSNGSKVYYSLKKDRSPHNEPEFEFQLYNGRWTYYGSMVASGTPFETFVLNSVKSDINNEGYVADGEIDIYIERRASDGTIKMINDFQKTTDELFTNNDIDDIKTFSEIFKNTKRVYSVRLNENKEYEIKFGNGIIGEMLQSGDVIHVFYLQTNGYDGTLNLSDYAKPAKFEHGSSFLNISTVLYERIFGDSSKSITVRNDGEPDTPDVVMISASSEVRAEEDVVDIRRSAPTWFKIGNRLITKDDFVYYLKNRYSNDIADIICQNNWGYVSTFYKWLYDLGKNKHNDPKYYITQAKLMRSNFSYVDPSDSNNVYLWTKLYVGSVQNTKDSYIEDLFNIKSLTVEPVFLDPIDVNFALCAADPTDAKRYLVDDVEFDQHNETYLEITVGDNNIYVASQIQTSVEQAIIEFFSVSNLSLGMTVNYNELMNNILAINGIENVRTIWVSKDDPTALSPRIFNGISFATWSGSYVDIGDDLDVGNSTITLQPFQFPKLYTNSLANKIKIVKKSVNNINRIQY